MRNGGEGGRTAVEESPWEAGDAGHFLFAGGTSGDADRKRFGPWTEKNGRAGEHTDAFVVAHGGGVAIAIIADGAQAAGEDMAQVSRHKLSSGDGFGLETIFVAVFPEEGDRFVGEGNNAFVADDAAGNISAEVSNGMGSEPDRFDMNAPVLGPDGGIDLPAFRGKETPEMLPESGLEVIEVNQIFFRFDADNFAISIDSRAGDKKV